MLRRAIAVLVAAAAVSAQGCGGDGGSGEPARGSLTIWSGENQPDRVRATRANLL